MTVINIVGYKFVQFRMNAQICAQHLTIISFEIIHDKIIVNDSYNIY